LKKKKKKKNDRRREPALSVLLPLCAEADDVSFEGNNLVSDDPLVGLQL
jgi:hypothetical protein